MITKQKFKISGMHCTACTLEVDDALEEIDGVKQSNTHYAKAVAEVTFDTDKLTEEKIVSIIQKVGYTAQPVKN